MKRTAQFLALLFLVSGCTLFGDPIAMKAVRLVRANYSDCEKILSVSIDTVTLGDNLDYRISQHSRNISHDEFQVKYYQDCINTFKRYGSSSRSIVDSYRKDLEKADSVLRQDKEILASLDSLKQATIELADTPTAYQICVCYNYATNLVWVQLAEDGTFLRMSKRMEDLLLNPGSDMPGYYDIIMRKYK